MAVVHAAARDERIELDESRARDQALPHFASWVDIYPFAAAVLLALRDSDYSETVQLPNPPHPGVYDVYGIRIDQRLADEHGVGVLEWFIKLRVYEAWSGETVFLVSLHPLEFPLRCIGGVLKPGGTP